MQVGLPKKISNRASDLSWSVALSLFVHVLCTSSTTQASKQSGKGGGPGGPGAPAGVSGGAGAGAVAGDKGGGQERTMMRSATLGGSGRTGEPVSLNPRVSCCKGAHTLIVYWLPTE